MRNYLTIIGITLLLTACTSSRERLLMNQMDSLVEPAINEYRKCEVLSNPPNKFECPRQLIGSLEKIYSDNPIKTLLIDYALDLQELALNYDKNRIDYTEYEHGKSKAKNKFARGANDLRAQERNTRTQRNSNALEDFSNELRTQNNNARIRQMETELLEQQQKLRELESRKLTPCGRLGC